MTHGYIVIMFEPKTEKEIDAYLKKQVRTLKDGNATLLASEKKATTAADGTENDHRILSEIIECADYEGALELYNSSDFSDLLDDTKIRTTSVYVLNGEKKESVAEKNVRMTITHVTDGGSKGLSQFTMALVGTIIGGLLAISAAYYQSHRADLQVAAQINADKNRQTEVDDRRKRAISYFLSADMTDVTSISWEEILSQERVYARVVEGRVLAMLPLTHWDAEEMSLFDSDFLKKFTQARLEIETFNALKGLAVIKAGPERDATLGNEDRELLLEKVESITDRLKSIRLDLLKIIQD